MGINTGYCNVGNFGSEQRLTYTIIGGEVNVAQRLEVAAKPNGILLSYETYAHAEDIIEVEVEDSIEMKGINREIKVYSVIRRRREKSRVVEVDNAEKSDVVLKTLDPVDKAQEDVSTVKELMSLVVELKRKVEEQEKDIKQLKDA